LKDHAGANRMLRGTRGCVAPKQIFQDPSTAMTF